MSPYVSDTCSRQSVEDAVMGRPAKRQAVQLEKPRLVKRERVAIAVSAAAAASNPGDAESIVKADVGEPASKINTSLGSQVGLI